MDHAIEDFISLDYASLLNLGRVDVEDLKEMLKPEEEEQ